MREFKAAILLALVLAFVGGLGAGAWIGSLRAAPQTPRRSVDRRLESWKERYELTPSQERRLREVLIRYDKGRDRVRAQMDAERWTHVGINNPVWALPMFLSAWLRGETVNEA